MEIKSVDEKENRWLMSPMFISNLMHRLVVEIAKASAANAIDKELVNKLSSYEYNEIKNIAQKVANVFLEKKTPIESLGSISSAFIEQFLIELKNSSDIN